MVEESHSWFKMFDKLIYNIDRAASENQVPKSEGDIVRNENEWGVVEVN